MSLLRKMIRRYSQSTEASAVEFAFIMPILFFVLVGILDGGALFAQQAKAQQIAESLVRTARALDDQIVSTQVIPLNDDTQALLRNIAARMQTQYPDGENYIWMGRYVRPLDGSPVRQTLPNGMRPRTNNQGIILAGKASYAAAANAAALDAFDATLQPGDIVYVVTIRYTQGLMSPLPETLKILPMEVQFAL